jgi:short-subunit dehydrogenase
MDNSSFVRDGDYAVIGATGNLGSPIAEQLYEMGANVHALARSDEDLESLAKHKAKENFHCYPVDVRDTTLLGTALPMLPKLDGLVYCIGHCPPRGFDDEIEHPLSEVPTEKLSRDIRNHVLYLVHTFKYFASKNLFNANAHIVVIGSAITRLTENTCPPWLHAWHYIAANAAKEVIVRGMRHDPFSKRLKLLIHYLAFGAVNTPFHEGCEHQPPKMIHVATVVKEVMKALGSPTYIHSEIVA